MQRTNTREPLGVMRLLAMLMLALLVAGCSDDSDSGGGALDVTGNTESVTPIDDTSSEGSDPDADVDAEGETDEDVDIPDISDGPEDTTGEDTPQIPSGTELCFTEGDEDGDGDADCDDSDCADLEACAPGGCTNGLDDDGNGQVDCGDSSCAQVSPCAAEGTAPYIFCLVEEGCGCEIGVDCPDSAPGWDQCQQACNNDTFCPGTCLETLDEPKLQAYYTYLDCAQTQCGGLQGPAFLECFNEQCGALYADFLVGGDLDCVTWQECNQQCGQANPCVINCYTQMTVEAYTDLVTYQQCQVDLCDQDGDGEGDGNFCFALSFWACSQTGGTCFELDELQSGEPCAATFDCLTSCAGLGEQTGLCLQECALFFDVASEHQEGLSALMNCAIETCGAGDGLTLACLADAAAGACTEQYAACGGALEICDNGEDDNGNDLTDCDDPACAEATGCAPGTEPVYVWIQDNTDACPVDEVELATPGVDIDAVSILGPDGVTTFADMAMVMTDAPGICPANPANDPLATTGKLDGLFMSLNGAVLRLTFPGGSPQVGDIFVYESGDASLESYTVRVSLDPDGADAVELGDALGTAALAFDLAAKRE